LRRCSWHTFLRPFHAIEPRVLQHGYARWGGQASTGLRAPGQPLKSIRRGCWGRWDGDSRWAFTLRTHPTVYCRGFKTPHWLRLGSIECGNHAGTGESLRGRSGACVRRERAHCCRGVSVPSVEERRAVCVEGDEMCGGSFFSGCRVLILRGSAELPLEDEFAHSADSSRSNLAAPLPLLSRLPNPCSRHRPLHVTRGRSRLESVRRIWRWRVGGELMWASQTTPFPQPVE
jgi:hypothetical protein